MRWVKYLAMAVFIALPFVGFYLGIKYQEIENTKISNSSQISPVNRANDSQGRLENNIFRYPPKNFQLTLQPRWELVPAQNIKLPPEFTGTRFAFKKQNTSCIAAYVHTYGRDTYRQTSFATRVSTQDNDQLDSSWYTPTSSLPNDFKFAQYERQYLNGEVRKNYYPTFYNDPNKDYFNIFILFSEEGKSVANDCDNDFSKMLTSIKTVFDTTTITQESKGFAYIQDYDPNPPPQPSRLVFVSDDTNIPQEVVQLGLTTPSMITVRDNKLLAILEGKVVTIDIFSKNISSLPGIVQKPGEVVNTFYLYQDKLWYLYGPDCTGYLEKCNLKLMEYGFNTGTSKALASGLTSRDIAGYEPVNDTLRLVHGEGDAGCFWASGEEYSFRDNLLKKVGSISGCDGDPESTSSSIKQWFDENSNFSKEHKTDTAMRIQNGIISFPNNAYPSPGNHASIEF